MGTQSASVPSADPITAHNIRQYSSPLIARLYARGEPYLQKPEAIALSMIEGDVRGGFVLDIGVGGGRTTPFLAPIAGRYLGLDPSPAMVRLARLRCPGAAIELGDVRSMPALAAGEASFALFSNNGIDCLSWDDRRRALAEVHRVLAPGGWFVFASHNRRALPIPKPWDLRNLQGAWSLANLARRIAAYPVGVWNYLRLRSRERHHADYSEIHDAGEGFYNLFQIYTEARPQAAQLAEAGFALAHVIELEGAVMDVDQADRSASLWLTYVCRKGGGP